MVNAGFQGEATCDFADGGVALHFTFDIGMRQRTYSTQEEFETSCTFSAPLLPVELLTSSYRFRQPADGL